MLILRTTDTALTLAMQHSLLQDGSEMANTKNSPTGGDIPAAANDAPAPGAESPNQPVISDGEVSPARAEESDADVSGDYAKQYPPAPVNEDDGDLEALSEAEEEAEAEAGEVWAKFVGPEVYSRGLTFADQTRLGIPDDRRVSNAPEASPAGLEGGPLQPGLWFTKQNRHRVNITSMHPQLVQFLDEHGDFEVTRY